ncbi:polysaccharide deacetylase family protein [Raineyella fluvialis]|uniref:Polysaccharide deacetylase family protein n=1 Tax=Raineyella fluvialis TaxID=2662261 RepID=A0A5Q2FAB2_9ACTN|nr:polysaccharide deacetylase family protein [Raineyella fluvialis]QGF23910.1 polysaccharide deacetylase family protein [Raineyella fluvialis]
MKSRRVRAGALLVAAILGFSFALSGSPGALAAPTQTPATSSPATATPKPTPTAKPTANSSSGVTANSDAAPQPMIAPDVVTAALTPGEEAIAAKAASSVSVLGAPTSSVTCGLVDGGCMQTFEHATIYWSPASGAHWTRGAIRDKWRSTGAQDGFLGYPVSDEFCGLVQSGCGQHFQHGEIYWTPSIGAHWLRGSIVESWRRQGWENGFLGYPLSDEFCGLRESGCGQHFQHGEIYWSPGTGAHWLRGSIVESWRRQGWENAFLGYPLSDEFCGLRESGCGQHFQHGEIYWSPGTGAHWLRGAIVESWRGQNWENGSLGYPLTDEFCGLVNSGCGQHFQHGEIYWSPGTGAHWLRGSIVEYWRDAGWENGRYGYPTSDEICRIMAGGVRHCEQTFPRLVINFRSDTGVIDCGRMKCIALSFDDGPSSNTSRLVDILDGNNVNATFFNVGQNVGVYPSTVRRSYGNGNEIMNHTWDHPDLTTLSSTGVSSELSRTSDVIGSTVGRRPTLMRPPYGAYNSTVTSVAGQQGMAVILWNIDTRDWESRNTSAVITAATGPASSGSIILMHDLYPTTVDAVPSIISNLKSRGYVLVTVQDVIGDPQPGRVYSRRP